MTVLRRIASQDRGRETQRKVLEGAAEIFGKSGYGVASLRAISDASGVSTGAMNFHFRSKEQIALAVIQEQRRREAALASQVTAQHESAIERLVYGSFALTDLWQSDLEVQAGIELSMQVGDFIVPTALPPSSWDQAVSTQLALGLEKGEFVSELNVDSLAKVYLACFAGVQVSSRTGVSREEPLSALRDLWIVLLAGLIPPEREAFARSVVEGAFAAHAS